MSDPRASAAASRFETMVETKTLLSRLVKASETGAESAVVSFATVSLWPGSRACRHERG